MKRFVRIITVLAIIAAAAWGAVRFAIAKNEAIKVWCAGQLQLLANDLLRPEIRIGSVEYKFPRGLTLREIELIDGDVLVADADSIRLELAGIPRKGEPLIIEEVYLGATTVRFIPGESGNLLGFYDIVESTTGEVRDDGGSSRPEDVFAIRRIDIEAGTIQYEPDLGPPMILDGINGSMSGSTSTENPDHYRFDGLIQRDELSSVRLVGTIDLDVGWLRFEGTRFNAEVRPDDYAMLPPGIQEVLSEHRIEGRLILDITGRWSFNDDTPTELGIGLLLEDSNIVFGEYQLPAERITADIDIAPSAFYLEALTVKAMRGVAHARANIERNETLDTQVAIEIDSMQVEDAFRPLSDREPKYAGAVSFTANGTMQLAHMPDSIAATGQVALSDARLVNTRVIGGLLQETDLAGKGPVGKDHGSCNLTFRGDLVELRNIDVVSGAMAVRGEGELTYESHINLRVNAGPLEFVQRGLGVFGQIAGVVTDQVVAYQVTGPYSDIEIKVKPLRIGADATKSEK